MTDKTVVYSLEKLSAPLTLINSICFLLLVLLNRMSHKLPETFDSGVRAGLEKIYAALSDDVRMDSSRVKGVATWFNKLSSPLEKSGYQQFLSARTLTFSDENPSAFVSVKLLTKAVK